MILADLGCETIKVEPLAKGEGTRRLLENDPDYSFNGTNKTNQEELFSSLFE